MNAALRRRHRQATLALALAVPPAFALALAARPVPPDATLPEALAVEPAVGAPLFDRDDRFAALPIRARVFEGEAGARVLELAPRVDPQRPDVLVYWSDAGAPADRVPGSARLLGRLAGREVRRFALPPGAGAGRVLLWSLGHGALVDSAPVE